MSDSELNTRTVPLTLGAFRLGPERRVSLLIYHRDGMTAAPLAEGRTLVVGRATTADICVPHFTLSAQHARFSLSDGTVTVEDLGSTNGTFLDGAAVTQCEVEIGHDVLLGDVTVSLHAIASDEGQLPGLSGHDRFLARLEEEVLRHQAFGRTLGLMLVRAAERKHGQLSGWCQRVRRLLRPVDHLAPYSPWAVEIVLPEADEALLREVAEAIVGGRDEGEPALLCGAALFPDAGTSAEQLVEAARTVAEQANAEQPFQLSSEAGRRRSTGSLGVTTSPAMQKVQGMVSRLARAAIPVLIVGETGSGKEVVATELHAQSPRSEKPLRCINCAAIPKQLIESILFGHERGAFTGADRRADGLFREADGGTVLLDEIGELSAEAQAALLRALETKRVTRVGSTDEQEVDVRVLAATHRDLEAMCAAGSFRYDLLFRINVMTLTIPPLRERVEEIPSLASLFLHEANTANGFAICGIDPGALELLQRHDWPGNVRELRNVIHRAVVLALGETVTIEDLPPALGQGAAPPGEASPPARSSSANEDPKALDADDGLDYRERVRRFEVRMIEQALASCSGNQTAAAQKLCLPVRTLSHKIRALGIEIPK